MTFFDTIFEATGISYVLDLFHEKMEESKQKKSFYLSEVKPKKFIYRPKFLIEYIGQEKAKELVNLNLKKILEIKPVHFLISGSAGHGKTTLANIIANHLGFDITYQIGGTFSLEALKDFLIASEKGKNPRILFIDEIHNLDKKIAEFLYPLVEDFILPASNTTVRPFILIGATTEKSTLIKKFKPLVDRCGAQIVLEDYNAGDINAILKQYNEQIYGDTGKHEVLTLISENCRFTPRIALALWDDYKVSGDATRVLNAHRIIKNSLTDSDIKILKHLGEIDKPVGEEALAIIGGVERADFKMLVEPFLLKQGYLSRTAKGRVITQKGKQLLGVING